jgi:hypothetical protein
MTMSSEQKLKRAIQLLSIDLVINILLGCAMLHLTLPGMGITIKVILIMISALIYAFFIWQINLKQNWARITSMIIFIGNLLGTAQSYATFNNISSIMNNFGLSHTALVIVYLIIPIIQRIIEGTALYFLFTKDTSKLFKKKSK